MQEGTNVVSHKSEEAHESMGKAATITEIIGKSYESWNQGDIILISGPTGSGKSYFVLHVLLEHVVDEFLETRKYHPIFYYVNRKILKDQLEDELIHKVQPILGKKEDGIRAKDFITIETYQSVESAAKNFINPILRRDILFEQEKTIFNQEYAYVVYDECHYFLSDSTYNPATELSFDKLTTASESNTQIFMSATMDSVKEVIYRRYNRKKINVYYAMTYGTEHFRAGGNKWGFKPYSVKSSYKNINLFGINDIKDLNSIITQNKRTGKWLIFVHSKAYGNELCKTLQKTDELKEEVVFIDAQYEADPVAAASVDEVVKKKYMDKKVVICTSVLDNGVSFHDERLRNVVILTDTEEEFIQMLGRKRSDGQILNLYICKQDRKFFSDKLNYVKKTRVILTAYEYRIKQLAPPVFQRQQIWNAINSLTTSFNTVCQNIPRIVNTYLTGLYDGKELSIALYDFNTAMTALLNAHQSFYHSLVNTYNWYIQIASSYDYQHQVLADQLLTSTNLYEHVSRFCYVAENAFHVSRFAVRRLEYLQVYYDNMNEMMRNDADAFLRVQANWIGKNLEDVIIIGTKISLTESERSLYKSMIIAALDKCVGQVMNESLRRALIGGKGKTNAKGNKSGNVERDNEFVKSLRKDGDKVKDAIMALLAEIKLEETEDDEVDEYEDEMESDESENDTDNQNENSIPIEVATKAGKFYKRVYHNELSGECLEFVIETFELPFTLTTGKKRNQVLERRKD